MLPTKSAVDPGPPSSPEVPLSSQNLNVSPSRASSNGQKEQRPPSVTPRKFKRFFTPRSHDYRHSSARRALHEITTPILNRNVTQSSPLRPFKSVVSKDNSKAESPTSFIRGSKRQKTTHTPETSPRKSSRRYEYRSPNVNEGEGDVLLSSPCERAAPDTSYINQESVEEDQPSPVEPMKRIVSRVGRGLGGQLLDLSIGSFIGSRRQHHVYPVNGSLKRRSAVYLNLTNSKQIGRTILHHSIPERMTRIFVQV
jgi:hypothetical protein